MRASVAVEALLMPSPPGNSLPQYGDGRARRVGTNEDVAWINDGVLRGRSITASIPAIFAAYATLAFPLDLQASGERMRQAEDRFDDALLSVLRAHHATAVVAWVPRHRSE